MNPKTKTVSSFAGVQHPQTVEIPAPLEIHPSVSEKAASLLLGVVEVLMREPHRYDQQNAVYDCGAPCCITGHMHMLAGSGLCFGWECIGLTKTQHDIIFEYPKWPDHLYNNRIRAKDIPASVGIARIEHFLRTGE